MTPTPKPLRFRKTGLVSLLAILTTLAAMRFRPKPYDPMMWLGDYEQLRHLMGDLYANLDWSAERIKPGLVELHANTYHDLVHASSDKEAEGVMQRFVQAFGDPHMALLPASAPPVDPPPSQELLSRFTPPETACTALHYEKNADGFAFALDRKTGFRKLPGSNSFPAGLLDDGGHRIGLLRIASFAERDYRGACLREWPGFRPGLPGTCEARCQLDFRFRVAARLLRELAWRARQLREAGAGALLIDVTGNGGGHGWYRRTAELFSSRPLPPLRAALIRGRYTAEVLQDVRQAVFRHMARHPLAAPDRAVLEEAVCRLNDLIAEAEHPCRAGALWTGEPGRLGCSRLTTRPYFGSGLFANDPGGDFPSTATGRLLNFDRSYPRLPTAWTGPVAVLVDDGTASAGELFAAGLKFGAGAVLLGRHTAAAGGGWDFGRTCWTLLRSRMKLYMPDSVEYWPDGANAREGLEPDIRSPLPPREDPAFTAKWLLKALYAVEVEPSRRF